LRIGHRLEADSGTQNIVWDANMRLGRGVGDSLSVVGHCTPDSDCLAYGFINVTRRISSDHNMNEQLVRFVLFGL